MSYEIIIREVSVLPNQCSSCRGSGKLEYRGAGFIECPACRGIGYIQSVRELDDPEMENHLLRCMHEHDMARRRASYLVVQCGHM